MKSLKVSILFISLVSFQEILGKNRSLTKNEGANSVEEINFDSSKVKSASEKYIPVTDPKRLQDSLRKLEQVTLEDLLSDPELESWKAPPKIRENFLKYYLTGYDDEDGPKLGKINLGTVIDGNQESIENMDKYCKQMAYRFFKSTTDQYYQGNEIMYITDAEGFDLRQMSHIPYKSLAYIMRLLTMYRSLIVGYLGGSTIIHANAAISIFTALVRPIFREAMEKVEILGTNKERWIPVLRSKFPVEVLPPWYGGKAEYKPLAVY